LRGEHAAPRLLGRCTGRRGGATGHAGGAGAARGVGGTRSGLRGELRVWRVAAGREGAGRGARMCRRNSEFSGVYCEGSPADGEAQGGRFRPRTANGSPANPLDFPPVTPMPSGAILAGGWLSGCGWTGLIRAYRFIEWEFPLTHGAHHEVRQQPEDHRRVRRQARFA
jgi:hypothetical protein